MRQTSASPTDNIACASVRIAIDRLGSTNSSDVKQAVPGFQGLLMVQGVTFAKGKFLFPFLTVTIPDQ